MKKVFIISGVLFVVVLGLWAVYNFVFKNSASNPIADPKRKEQAAKELAELVVNPEGRLEAVVNDTMLGAVLGDNSILYYSIRDKALKRVTLDGKDPVTLYAEFPGAPTRFVWSPRRDAVLCLVENSGQPPLWHHLKLAERKLTPLKSEMSRLAWANVGESIFYQFTDGAGRVSLNTADPNGGDWKKLVDLDPGSYFLAPIPRSSLLSFWKRPNGLETNKLETMSLVGENRRTLVENRFGTDFLWAENGERVLIGSVSEKERFEPVLGIANDHGGEYRDLKVPTLVSKVVWSKDHETIYYALPGPFPKESVLPNDYFSRTVTTKDTFWKMNVVTGKRERLIPLDEIRIPVDAIDLFLPQDELTLFFTDRTSGKLYKIGL